MIAMLRMLGLLDFIFRLLSVSKAQQNAKAIFDLLQSGRCDPAAQTFQAVPGDGSNVFTLDEALAGEPTLGRRNRNPPPDVTPRARERCADHDFPVALVKNIF